MSEFNRNENHLKGQTSPYLIQHLYNPVDWYPWGEDALEKARKENKPILISIGYSACHWCHVMERESFENQQVAEIMNTHFVCIKVDREERPDIDNIYMNAVQLISGQGGWPLNCFALPDGRPFWGATYFPKDQWQNILLRIHELFQNQLNDLVEQADKLTKGISESTFLPVSQGEQKQFDSEAIHAMARSIVKNTDMKEGGTMGAPKFPLPAIYEFLLHYHAQNPESKEAIHAVDITLKKMALGGIYDQIGGGFARYSVDEIWKVPHFEKMLYDNAQLTALYSKAWKVNQLPLYKQVVNDTIAFVQRELTSSFGTFYSALDADSEGEEGKYYVWTKQDIQQLLGEDAPIAIKYFNLGGKGLWEKGQNILLRNITNEEFANEMGIDITLLQQKVTHWKEILLKERENRIKPGLDNKVIISWNALMIDALTEAGNAFENMEWIDRAQKAMDFILARATADEGKLFHTLNDEKPKIEGFLEDYACMIKALINLGTYNEKYFLTAHDLLLYVLENFSDPKTHMFSFSSVKGEKLVAPYFDFQDNVIPASNSIMARNLFYLGNIFEEQQWIKRSENMLRDMEPQIAKHGRWTANWGILGLHHQKDFYTLAVCGREAANKAAELRSRYLPDTLLCVTEQSETQIPVLQNRYSEEETLIYPCTLNACLSPQTDLDEALKMING